MSFPVAIPPGYLAKAASLGIRASDISEQFVRGSGHGGQKINKTSSAVYLVHRPTGTEVKVQKYREQSKNRLSAYKLLILKIEDRKKGKESVIKKKMFKLKKQKQRRSRRAKEKMLGEKHLRGIIKKERRNDFGDLL